jgi:hypothetical protein
VKKVSEQLLQDPFTARMAEKYGSQPDSTLAKYAGDIRALQGDYTAPVSDDDMRRMQMQSMIVNLGNIAGRGFHNRFAGPYLQAENPYAPQLQKASTANMKAKADWREGQQKSKMATLDLFAKNAMQRDREKSNLAKVMELFGTSPAPESKPETGHLSGGGRTNLESARAPQSATSSALPSVPGITVAGLPQASQPAAATGLTPSDAPPASSVAPTQDVTTPPPVGQPTPQQVFKLLPRLAQARVMEAARGDVGKAVDLAYDMWRQQQGDQRENQKMSLNERKFAWEQEKYNNKRNGADGAGVFEDQEKALKFSQGLRKEYAQQSKSFVDVRDAYNRIKAVASAPSAAGDISLIINYMKMLDPGSVVREGEFATAENASGVGTKIRNMYNKMLTGERLTPAQRADFINQAESLYGVQLNSHERLRSEFDTFAREAGLDPERVLQKFANPTTDSKRVAEALARVESGTDLNKVVEYLRKNGMENEAREVQFVATARERAKRGQQQSEPSKGSFLQRPLDGKTIIGDTLDMLGLSGG